MIIFLSECWRLAQRLLRPEDSRDGTWRAAAPATALTGAAKALVWACAAVLLGLGLGQLR